MKQNKRFFLVALALMVATCLFAGVAMAEEVQIKVTKINVDPAGTVTLKLDDAAVHPLEETRWIDLTTYFFTPDFDTSGIAFKNGVDYVSDLKWTISDTSYGTLTRPVTDIGGIARIYDGEATLGPDGTGKLYEDEHVLVECPRLYLTDKTGEFTVTASSLDGTVKGSFTFKLEPKAEATKNPITGIEFTQPSYSIKLGNDTLNNLNQYVTVTWQNPDAAPEDFDFYWTSSDKTVATVEPDSGLVKVKKIGSAEITLTIINKVSGGDPVTGKVTVNVVDNPVTSFVFSPAAYELTFGEKVNDLKDTLVLTPADAYWDPAEAGAITFISSDPTVATITTNGSQLEAVGVGEATITATLYNKVAKDYVTGKFTVKVGGSIPVEKIEFTEKVYTIGIGDPTIDLYDFVRLTPDKDLTGYDKGSLHWTSSDITIASVDDDGDVRGHTPGDVTIKAFIYDKVAKKKITGECTVKVLSNYAPLEKISFTQDEY